MPNRQPVVLLSVFWILATAIWHQVPGITDGEDVCLVEYERGVGVSLTAVLVLLVEVAVAVQTSAATGRANAPSESPLAASPTELLPAKCAVDLCMSVQLCCVSWRRVGVGKHTTRSSYSLSAAARPLLQTPGLWKSLVYETALAISDAKARPLLQAGNTAAHIIQTFKLRMEAYTHPQ